MNNLNAQQYRFYEGVLLFLLVSLTACQANPATAVSTLSPRTVIAALPEPTPSRQTTPIPAQELTPLPQPTLTVLPSPEATPVTIQVEGETVILIPGENISPENYALAQDPELNTGSNWVLVDGFWEPLALGVDIAVEICQVNLIHPDCAGTLPPTPLALPGVPHALQTYIDPLGRFTFDYPDGWYTLPVSPSAAAGIWVLDAPSLEEATQWVSFDVFSKPEQMSLEEWLADGKGDVWAGQITESHEDLINGTPVIRQRLENNNPTTGQPYVYTLIWWPAGEYFLLWTAWPGTQPEMLNILERMVTGFRHTE